MLSGNLSHQRNQEQALLLIDYLLMFESRMSRVSVQSVRHERKQRARG